MSRVSELLQKATDTLERVLKPKQSNQKELMNNLQRAATKKK